MKKSIIIWIIVLVVTNGLWFGFTQVLSREAVMRNTVHEAVLESIDEYMHKTDSLYQMTHELERKMVEYKVISDLQAEELKRCWGGAR